MIAWVVGVPLFLGFMVVALDRLEAWIVAPIDRAERIRRILASEIDEGEVEQRVARLLAPVVGPVGPGAYEAR